MKMPAVCPGDAKPVWLIDNRTSQASQEHIHSKAVFAIKHTVADVATYS